VPTTKQRRQAAQRHLQRQLERRAELARKRRRNLGILATVAVVAIVVSAVILLNNVGGEEPSATADPTTSDTPTAAAGPAAPSTNPDGTVACDYAPDDSGNPNLTDVGTPTGAESTPAEGTTALLMSTNQGDLTLTLDRAKAPCAAASFAYLAQQKFFDGSTCHREVNSEGMGILQCGDPTGTGQGGPTYRYAEEVTPDTTYPRGAIAMAKGGAPGTTGSQFFLVFSDTQLPPEYTVVGTIDDAGLAVLDEIAKSGNDGSFEPSPGGGAPKIPVEIETISVRS
jgi:cyclophilin family peptidyl-prolyl cis-trans isomerase